MSVYTNVGVNLSKGQINKLINARKKDESVTIRLTKAQLTGDFKLPLTKTQHNRIQKSKKGVQLTLSKSQLKHMEKTGGFIPLLALIPIIASALGAAGGVAGGVASAVSSAKSNAEQARHNRAIEEQLKSGSGIVASTAGKIPVIGKHLEPLLQKIGLGCKDLDKLENGNCVCFNGKIVRHGKGLYLDPQGTGIFLGHE